MMELGNLIFGHSRGEFPIPDRTLYRELMQPLLDALGTDSRGVDFSNDVFEMRPYCWCGSETCSQCGDVQTQFNFVHHPTGLQMSWYKYALRDAYANQELTEVKFKEVIVSCIVSVPKTNVLKSSPLESVAPDAFSILQRKLHDIGPGSAYVGVSTSSTGTETLSTFIARNIKARATFKALADKAK